MDLVCLQEGFSSLIKNADPQHLGPFFVWLDFKVAQFKINGTFSPEKSKPALEKVTKNLFENDSTTPTSATTSIMFPGTSHLEAQSITPTYMSTPVRDNKAYINHLSKSLSFSESKLSLYQLNWEALDPRLGFRNGLNPTFPPRGPLFPQLFPEILPEPIDFSDKKKSIQGNNNTEEHSPVKSEVNQNINKPKEGIRSLLREVLSRPRELPMSSTPIKTPPQVKEEKIADTPSDVLVVLPEEPIPPANESRQETRHLCTICQKEFNYKSSYRRHMKIHQGLYSHTCCICTRKFTRKEHFVRHKCDRRPNKPNRRSAVLDISMNSEPDSSSLVKMDDPDVDTPTKTNPIGAAMVGSVGSPRAWEDPSASQGAMRQLFPPDRSGVNKTETTEEEPKLSTNSSSSSRDSPRDQHDDELNKNLESRRKSSTPRKFVPHSSNGGASDNEERGSGQVQRSENNSTGPALRSSRTPQTEAPEVPPFRAKSHARPSSARGSRTPGGIVGEADAVSAAVVAGDKRKTRTEERHLDLQTGTYVVSTSLGSDREEETASLAIKIKKQAKYLKLKNEARVVDGTLRFECPQCGKIFYRSSNFSRHMRIHRGIYSYVCQACRRGFFRKEHFQKHKCHRRGQDSHSDVVIGRSLMPSTSDARGAAGLLDGSANHCSSSGSGSSSNVDCKTSTQAADQRLPYLSLYHRPEDANNLIRCLQ